MRAFTVQPEEVHPDLVVGRILCHDVVGVGTLGRVKLAKGRVLSVEDVPVMRTFAAELHLLDLDTTDVHEDDAARQLGAALAGQGITVSDPVESQAILRARERGVFCVQPAALEAINRLPDISVFSVYDGQPVSAGKAVAAAKVTPLAISASVLEEAIRIAQRAAPVAQVRPFVGMPVGVVVRERLTSAARDKFESAIRMKLDWFGSPISGIRYLPESVDAIAEALREFLDGDVGLILAAGVNSTDPLDLTIQALDRIGACTEKRGVPAHPGSTCWLAYVKRVPIFGLALCGMFSRTTVLDLLLPRFLSGQSVRAIDLAAFGHGGMLGPEMAFRFPPYDQAH